MDIVLVSFNSEKWIKNCLESINNSKPISETINIHLVDNNSSDNTVGIAKKVLLRDGIRLNIIQSKENLGFGRANNKGAQNGNDSIILFINIDTEMYPDTFEKLVCEINESSDDIGVWELRQTPYEHCKLYNPVTRNTSWVSGAAFAVRREVFESINGFDPHIFMYGEDVDISWRIRNQGYKLLYCPKVRIKHYAYSKINEVKPTQYVESIINNLSLRYRYGSVKTILRGYYLFATVLILHHSPFKGAKGLLLKRFLSHLKDIHYYRQTRVQDKTIGQFLDWDYEIVRDGSFLEYDEVKNNDLVSVVVRTCGRPDVLRETLISLRNQTYSNFEVVIVEDGPEVSKDMIDKEFSDLRIQYKATKEKKGRSYAGNTAMSLANGRYLNFLDDDDVFYADHLEVLMSAIEKSSAMAVYSFSFETPIEIISKSPYVYDLKSHIKRYTQEFDRNILKHHNFMPIQCILFEKTLFDRLGGFDETLDYLEDWDLWVRYLQLTDYSCIKKTTSEYRVPYKNGERMRRQKSLDDAYNVVVNKQKTYNL